MVSITESLDRKALLPKDQCLLSGGGTVFFDLVSKFLPKTQTSSELQVLIRPGCYLSHDSGIYDEFQNELLERSELARSVEGELTSAIEVLTHSIDSRTLA